jgi:hypothetical protein
MAKSHNKIYVQIIMNEYVKESGKT